MYGGVEDVPVWLLGDVPSANALAVYLAKGAADLAASYANLANPGVYTLAPGNAPTFDTAVGWTGDGSADNLIVAAGTGPTLSAAASFICRLTPGAGGATRGLIGGQVDGALGVRLTTANNPQLWINGVGNIGTATTALTEDCVIAVTYSAAGVYTYYLNGTPDGTATIDRAVSTDSDKVMAANGCSSFNGVMAWLGVYDVELTSTQVGLISAAVLTL